MSIQLPTIHGTVPGFWAVEMRLPHTTTLVGAPFRDGFSLRPLRGREFRHLLAAMGKDVRGAFRCTCRGEAMSEVVGELSTDPWVVEPYQGYVDRNDIAEADSYNADDHFEPAPAEDEETSEDDVTVEAGHIADVDAYEAAKAAGTIEELPADADEDEAARFVNYEEMTVPTLRELARERGVVIAALKSDLIANLRAAEATASE